MRLLSSTLLLVTLVPTVLSAQPSPAGGQTVTAGYSWSAPGDVTRGGAPAGEVGVNAFLGSWSSSAALSPATRLNYGVNWERFTLDRTGADAVPDTLQEVSVTLGASHRLGRAWMLVGTVRPGLYGDGEGGDGDAFNAPLLLLATWVRSPELAWAFGLRADWFSERPVIPFVGVNWKFAPGWEFALGLPRAGLTYDVADTLKLSLGASVQGGNFHVARDPRGAAAVGPRLDDTLLDYHEIRVGVAADWRVNDALTFTVGAGVITDQKFDYFDRSHTLDGGGNGYVTLSLTGRF